MSIFIIFIIFVEIRNIIIKSTKKRGDKACLPFSYPEHPTFYGMSRGFVVRLFDHLVTCGSMCSMRSMDEANCRLI
jgi:hypothetical protein